uniref:ABH1 n=1 Tax=Arundo donax TaxID=35708 RepID=A0A0A9E7W2_ARUDO
MIELGTTTLLHIRPLRNRSNILILSRFSLCKASCKLACVVSTMSLAKSSFSKFIKPIKTPKKGIL